LEARARLDIMSLGTARERVFHFPKELIVVIDKRDIDCDRFADTGIGEMVRDIFPICFVGEPLADLGQSVLAIGILDVG
jgi:hypothetical protein